MSVISAQNTPNYIVLIYLTYVDICSRKIYKSVTVSLQKI